MGAREGIGGVIGIVLLCGLGYAKFARMQARWERSEASPSASSLDRRDAAADELMLKSHACEMMEQCKCESATKAYLTWGVESYHAQARDETPDVPQSGVYYRDKLIALIMERANSDKRADVTKALTALTASVKAADPETWWVVPGKKPKK